MAPSACRASRSCVIRPSSSAACGSSSGTAGRVWWSGWVGGWAESNLMGGWVAGTSASCARCAALGKAGQPASQPKPAADPNQVQPTPPHLTRCGVHPWRWQTWSGPAGHSRRTAQLAHYLHMSCGGYHWAGIVARALHASQLQERCDSTTLFAPLKATHVEHAAAQALRAAAGSRREPGGLLEGVVLHPAQDGGAPVGSK